MRDRRANLQNCKFDGLERMLHNSGYESFNGHRTRSKRMGLGTKFAELQIWCGLLESVREQRG